MPRPRGGDWLEDEIRSLGEQGVGAAFEQVAEARGCPVPDTPQQRAWAVALSRQLRG